MKKFHFLIPLLLFCPGIALGQTNQDHPTLIGQAPDSPIQGISAVSNALEFDGADDYVGITNGTALFANLTEFSMCGWVFPTNANANWPDFDGYFGIKNENVCDFYVAQINGTGIEARITTSTGTYTIDPPMVSQVTPGEWHHYALVYTGSELQLYLNGTLDGSVAASGLIPYNNMELTFGKLVFGFNDFYLDGKLDEVTLWDKALTEEEVQEYLCISGDPSAIPGLAAYYNFNEEQGLVLPDYFGNYNGTLSNMTGNEWIVSEVCESGFNIVFLITDELTSEPVEGAEVNLEGVTKITDGDGTAVFSNYDPGTYVYEVTRDDYYDAFGEVEVIDEDIIEEVILAPVIHYSLTFIVTENPGAVPIDSAIVNVEGLLKYTDETGTAVFTGYLPGSYTYNVSKPGYFLIPGVATITDDDLIINITLVTTGISEYSPDVFIVYPNPAREKVSIDHPGPDREMMIRVLAPDGRCVLERSGWSKKEPIDVHELTPGVYFLEVSLEDHRVMKSLVVE